MKCLHTSDINAALIYVLDSRARVWVFCPGIRREAGINWRHQRRRGGCVVAAQAAGHRRHQQRRAGGQQHRSPRMTLDVAVCGHGFAAGLQQRGGGGAGGLVLGPNDFAADAGRRAHAARRCCRVSVAGLLWRSCRALSAGLRASSVCHCLAPAFASASAAGLPGSGAPACAGIVEAASTDAIFARLPGGASSQLPHAPRGSCRRPRAAENSAPSSNTAAEKYSHISSTASEPAAPNELAMPAWAR